MEPLNITVHGVECEPGMNGTYELNGLYRGLKSQWMIPNTRRYVRFIRNRWEIYVSHHPQGTTYFYHPNVDADIPPTSGWMPTECAMSHESPTLIYSEEQKRRSSNVQSDIKETTLSALSEQTSSSMPSSSPLTLWSNDTCPYAQRVRIVLQETGLLSYTRVIPVDVIGDKDATFVSLWQQLHPNVKHRRPAIPLLKISFQDINNLEEAADNHMRSSSDHKVEATGAVSTAEELLLSESKIICEFIQNHSWPTVMYGNGTGNGSVGVSGALPTQGSARPTQSLVPSSSVSRSHPHILLLLLLSSCLLVVPFNHSLMDPAILLFFFL